MHIRQANLNDIEIILPLFNGYRSFYKQPIDSERARHFLIERLKNKESTIFLAFLTAKDKRAVGFTQVYPLFSSVSMEPMILLNDLFIDPTSRGRGIGKALIEKVKELCMVTKQKGIALQTGITNPAQRLYEREGFTIDRDLFYFWTNK